MKEMEINELMESPDIPKKAIRGHLRKRYRNVFPDCSSVMRTRICN